MILFISEQRNIHDERLFEGLSSFTKVIWQPNATKELIRKLPKQTQSILMSPLNCNLIETIKDLYSTTPIYLLSYAQELLEVYGLPNARSHATLKQNLSLCDGVIVDCSTLEKILRNNFGFKGKILKTTYFWQQGFLKSTTSKEKHKSIGTNRTFTAIHNNKLIFESLSEIEQFQEFYFIAQGEELRKVYDENYKLSSFGRKCVPMSFSPDQTEFFSKIGIYVSASIYDGTSISLLEAMLSGKVCVVPDIPCNMEIIQDGVNGFLYKNNSKNNLTQVLKSVLSLRESVRDEIEKNAITTAERLTNSSRNIEDIFNFVY